MKAWFLAALIAGLAVVAAGLALAAQPGPSLDRGKKLFDEVRPGATGKACVECHENGKGLEAAGERSDLSVMINKCIAGAQHGTTLAPDSVDMQSLILYVKYLAAKVKAPVGC